MNSRTIDDMDDYNEYKRNINMIVISIAKSEGTTSPADLERLFMEKCVNVGDNLAAALIHMSEHAFIDGMSSFALFFHGAFINPDSSLDLLPARASTADEIQRTLSGNDGKYLQRYETLLNYARKMASFIKYENWNPFKLIGNPMDAEDDENGQGSLWEEMLSGDLE
jgi:hypothetical protein